MGHVRNSRQIEFSFLKKYTRSIKRRRPSRNFMYEYGSSSLFGGIYSTAHSFFQLMHWYDSVKTLVLKPFFDVSILRQWIILIKRFDFEYSKFFTGDICLKVAKLFIKVQKSERFISFFRTTVKNLLLHILNYNVVRSSRVEYFFIISKKLLDNKSKFKNMNERQLIRIKKIVSSIDNGFISFTKILFFMNQMMHVYFVINENVPPFILFRFCSQNPWHLLPLFDVHL